MGDITPARQENMVELRKKLTERIERIIEARVKERQAPQPLHRAGGAETPKAVVLEDWPMSPPAGQAGGNKIKSPRWRHRGAAVKP